MVFAETARRAKLSIGGSALNLANLVWLGIASAMQQTVSFAFVLTMTLKLLEDQAGFRGTAVGQEKKKAQRRSGPKGGTKGKPGGKSKHHPHRDDPTQLSEESFAQARRRMPLQFWVELITVLAHRFEQDHWRHLYFRGYRLLALDGTTLKLQNDQRLRDHFGRPRNGRRKKAAPQARMAMLTLPTVRLAIAYEVAPLADSELDLAGRLVNHVRDNDLVLMDRGFTSYGLFWQITNRGAYFGTRMKKALNLRTTRRLGPKDRLVVWTPSDSRGQWEELPRSITLRVIDYKIRGFRPSAIVTNALDPDRLPREEWVRLANDCAENGELKPGLYHRRWEIETTYSELKVTLGLKSLRSRTPASVQYEVAGCVVYHLLLRWLIVQAAEKHDLDPLRISFTNAARELEPMRSTIITSSPQWVSSELLPRLLGRIASHTVPLRPGRHYPRPNDTKAKDKGHGQKQRASKLSKRVNSNHGDNAKRHRREA
jgi:hypothetical protein